MCKHALAGVPLISPGVTLMFEFWVSDKAALVLHRLSPTKTVAKHARELTPKPHWMAMNPNNIILFTVPVEQNGEICLK